jgi:hypothetical protein
METVTEDKHSPAATISQFQMGHRSTKALPQGSAFVFDGQ